MIKDNSMGSRSVYGQYVVAVGSIETPELSTHTNYLNYLWRNTRSLRIEYGNRVERSDAVTADHFKERINLASLTFKSLQEEMRQVYATHEYARVCSAWVAIKSYYLLFYLETILYSLIDADKSKLKVSHEKVRKFVRSSCKSSALTSSFDKLTKTTSHADCRVTGLSRGANLRGQLDDEQRHKQLMKKLMGYAREEFKRKKGIVRLSGNNASIFNSQDICLMDFFYWYRIKSNYRDLEFIAGEKASTDDLFDFYKMYNEVATSLARAYATLINNVFTKRTGNSAQLLELT